MGKISLRRVLVLIAVCPALHAENLISVGIGQGTAGDGDVAVPVLARHDDPIHGYSLSIAYARSAIRLLEISAGGTSAEAVGVDFFDSRLDDAAGTAVLGAIFSLSDPYGAVALPPTEPDGLPQLLAWLHFSVLSDAPAGDHEIALVDGFGHPPISNRFTRQGVTIKPGLQDGGISVLSDDVLTIESKYAFPGSLINALYVHARHPKPLQGYQVGVSYDPRALELTGATIQGTSTVTQLGGLSRIEFSIILTDPSEIAISSTEYRTTTGIIFDYLEPYSPTQVLPPETSSTTKQSIMKYSFRVKDGADALGEYAALTFSDSESYRIANVFIADSESYVPRKVNGRIYFSTGSLTGKILNFMDGQPLSGVTVALEPGGLTARSTADGSVTFSDIPPGPYSASATRNGFYSARTSCTVPGQSGTEDFGTILLFPRPVGSGFRRGYVNEDNKLDISDGIALLGILFLGNPMASCQKTLDVNDDSRLDVSDGIFVFSFLFTGGKPPPAPLVSCGEDPTPDTLTCVQFNYCQ
jgi:hypothetical protein